MAPKSNRQRQRQPVAAPSHVVAHAFAEQYYHILHHSPELVHRFYQDISKLGRPDSASVMSSVTTMQAINEKILSLEFSYCKTEIATVDAQDSYNGGVLILVTGYLTGKDNIKKNFIQTFFLAPQEKGYFVLNDMFRYVEPADQQLEGNHNPESPDNGPGTPASHEHDTFQAQEQQSPEPVASPEEEGEMNVEEAFPNMICSHQAYDEEKLPSSKLPSSQCKDGYVVFRSEATHYWENMKSYKKKAEDAYSKGNRAHASILSDKANFYRQLAREADEKASQQIFAANNNDVRNSTTIDLHGQHIKQAIAIVKHHLWSIRCLPSTQLLRVVTGYGSHGTGRGKLKNSVIGLLRKEGIDWDEDNPGSLTLKVVCPRKFSFSLDRSNSDSE